MLVNDPESLKSWLIVVLEPLCDADSSALARYVLALLKKDKPLKELKKVMIEQLDVFLSVETKPFVDKLFDAINSEEYLIASPASVPATNVEIAENTEIKVEGLQEQNFEIKITTTPSSSAYIKKEQTPPLHEGKTKEISHKNADTFPPANNCKDNCSNLTLPQVGVAQTNDFPSVKAIADKENQPREPRRRRASFRSRSRSRSRSNDRLSRRSRSRDRRPSDREKNQRQFRNKSPPTSEIRHLGSHERRRGGVGANDRRKPVGIGNLEDRSPRYPGSGGEGRKGRSNHSNSRSRSASLERVGRSKCSPVDARTARTSPDRHHHAQRDNEKRQRCRDFDEKGYCVRGETCPWDHGVNPVVFEGINNSALISMSLREYNPDAPDLWSRGASADNPIVVNNPVGIAAATGAAGINPFTGAARTGSVMVGVPSGNTGFPHIAGVGDKLPNTSGLLPSEYQRSQNAGFRDAAPLIPFPFNPAAIPTPLQRELIPIPVVDAGTTGGDVGTLQQSNKRRYDIEDSVLMPDGPPKRKIPLNNRLGPRIPNMQNNCSLELRKIPRGLNTIAHLNNHFAKFGKIVNIQISYDGDPEAAIVTFSTHAEANVAYRSTEAVLNNRFIKVFWHCQDVSTAGPHGLLKEENLLAPMGAGGRKNSQYHVNNVTAIPTPAFDSTKISNATSMNQLASNSANALDSTSTTAPTSSTTTTMTAGSTAAAGGSSDAVNSNPANVVAVSHAPLPSLRLKNNVPRGIPNNASNAIIRKKQEEQAKAVVQLANGLRKRKQELLQSYVKQMKSALELVERCEPNDPQRAKTVATIKVLEETIDKLRKEIAAEQEQIQAQIQNQQLPSKKTKEQQKKELLDIELELFAQQQEGNDTSSIQKRLDELQRSLGIVPGSVHPNSNSALVGGNKQHFAANRANNRGRPSFPEVSTRVDRRPKTIVITGFTKDEADFVLGHFKHFGEITKHDVNKEIPQLILTYATRLNAEHAILRGKLFKDKRLQISWAPATQAAPPPTTCSVPAKPQETKGEDTQTNSSDIDTTDTLPELRLEDEEEDEECEDRSWRR